MKSSVYIMQSQKRGEYYVGSSQNVARRLIQHNQGNVKATMLKRPYKLLFSQEFESKETAEKVERKIKSWKRRDFIEKITKDGKIKFVGN